MRRGHAIAHAHLSVELHLGRLGRLGQLHHQRAVLARRDADGDRGVYGWLRWHPVTNPLLQLEHLPLGILWQLVLVPQQLLRGWDMRIG